MPKSWCYIMEREREFISGHQIGENEKPIKEQQKWVFYFRGVKFYQTNNFHPTKFSQKSVLVCAIVCPIKLTDDK